MSTPNGMDPLERLRAADPVRSDDVPDASLARISATLQEHIVSVPRDPNRIPPTRRPLAWAGGLAIAGALALAVAVGTGNLGGQPSAPVGNVPVESPTPNESQNPAAGGGEAASCLVYDPANLPTFDVVFDGTVTAVDGDQVTFDVNQDLKGAGDSITLTVPEVNVAIQGPLPDFEVGGRYLVTAFGDTINACGYTLDYDAATAEAWAQAFATS